jgi:very-short-patch-repair endonuclease
MNSDFWRVCALAEKQHGVVAVWQMVSELGLGRARIRAVCKELTRVHRGVYAVGDLSELGWYRAATLALGPDAVVSDRSALMLLELLPHRPRDIHVSVPGYGGRAQRDGIVVHRRTAMETGTCKGIPVTSPDQSLKDADLQPYELYRALELAEKAGYPTTLPVDALPLHPSQVRGRTRSPAEAMALILMAENHITLPRVNHVLNGIETDFHWPRERIVLEVDGWEFHKEREQFEDDRRRGLVHTAAGWQVIRISALQVQEQPELLLAALQTTGW